MMRLVLRATRIVRNGGTQSWDASSGHWMVSWLSSLDVWAFASQIEASKCSVALLDRQRKCFQHHEALRELKIRSPNRLNTSDIFFYLHQSITYNQGSHSCTSANAPCLSRSNAVADFTVIAKLTKLLETYALTGTFETGRSNAQKIIYQCPNFSSFLFFYVPSWRRSMTARVTDCLRADTWELECSKTSPSCAVSNCNKTLFQTPYSTSKSSLIHQPSTCSYRRCGTLSIIFKSDD